MAAKRAPSTNAIRVLRQSGVLFDEHLFDYRRHPGAEGAAEAIGVDLQVTVKTIVFSTDDGEGVLALMHGDREVSTKKLARAHGVKAVRPATKREADKYTGYQFGGTSPLGTRTLLPTFCETSIAELDLVYVNAGSRGFLISIAPTTLIDLTGAQLADIAVD